MSNLKVLFVTAEIYPFSKTGGLGDLSLALPKALRKRSVDIRAISFKYQSIPQKFIPSLNYITTYDVDWGPITLECKLWKTIYQEVPVYFVDNCKYLCRDKIYGYYDAPEQALFFAKSVLAGLPLTEFQPDIIHCNDWQCGMIPFLLKTKYKNVSFYNNIKTLLMLHNIGHQGIGATDLYQWLEVDWDFFLENCIDISEYANFLEGEAVLADCIAKVNRVHTKTTENVSNLKYVNFIKVGAGFADHVTTVSPTHAKEIKNLRIAGQPLYQIFLKYSQEVDGILNGIDYEQYNPDTDPHIFKNYSREHPEGKIINKKKLQKFLNLPVQKDIPIISWVSRLDQQKGLNLLQLIMPRLLEEELQFILCGDGKVRDEAFFRKVQADYPVKFRYCNFDEVIERKIHAGSDMFVLPSQFEPCGLSQQVSMRYGSVPIVRATGGLADTVQEFNELSRTGTGFLFQPYNPWHFFYTVQKAIKYYQNKDIWKNIVDNCMHKDCSWEALLDGYITLYKSVVFKNSVRNKSDDLSIF